MTRLSTETQVKQGRRLGAVQEGLFIFKELPFTNAPIRDLRWRVLQSVKNWNGVLQANKFIADAMQGGTPPSVKSDDCLYINVATPEKTIEEKSSRMDVWRWTNFSKYGDPNGNDVPNCPAFNNEYSKLMYDTNMAYSGPVPIEKSLETLDSYFSWRRTVKRQAWVM